MTTFSLTLLVMVSAAAVRTIYCDCDLDSCRKKFETIGTSRAADLSILGGSPAGGLERAFKTEDEKRRFCRGLVAAIDCLVSNWENNPECSFSRPDINALMEEIIKAWNDRCKVIRIKYCEIYKCKKIDDIVDNTVEMCRELKEIGECMKRDRDRELYCYFMNAYIAAMEGMVEATFKAVCTGNCDIRKCNTSSAETEQCKALNDYIVCADEKVNNNPGCSKVRKMLNHNLVKRKKQRKDKCGGVAGLTSSLALSLGFSIVTYFLTVFK